MSIAEHKHELWVCVIDIVRRRQMDAPVLSPFFKQIKNLRSPVPETASLDRDFHFFGGEIEKIRALRGVIASFTESNLTTDKVWWVVGQRCEDGS